VHNIIIIITVIKLNMVKKLVSYFTLKKVWDIVQVCPDSPCQIEWTEYTRLQIIQYYSQMASNNNNNNNTSQIASWNHVLQSEKEKNISPFLHL